MDFDAPYRISEDLLIFYFAMFLFPLMPLSPIIAMAGIVLNIILDKYLLVRRCKRPDHLSGELGSAIIYIMAFAWVYYLLGNLLFTFDFSMYATSSKIKLLFLVLVTAGGLLIENLITGRAILNVDSEDIKIREKCKDYNIRYDAYRRKNPIYSNRFPCLEKEI